MVENHFRLHFSPFQINMQLLLICFTKWLPAAILDDRKSLSVAFLAISDQYGTFFSQNGCRRPFWMTENHFRSHFSPFQINTQFLFLAPPAERQRSFSNADSSIVVRRRPSSSSVVVVRRRTSSTFQL